MPREVGVVIVGAGQGARLGGDTPKQFRSIAGIPMLLRSLRPFTAHPDVSTTVVVLPPELVDAPPEWLSQLTGPALRLVAGGAERTDSAMAGVGTLPSDCTIVLVHDAARPFVDRAIIDAVIARAREGQGAVPALPLSDTLKQASTPGQGGGISATIPREGLYRAQTPQGFPRTVLEQAYAAARTAGRTATDDAALVEAIGAKVTVVPGSEQNIKITTAHDLRVAEWLAGGAGA
ncbi:MAG: 2-C-methyl-D-erythritol 4-phosphate cytidylyltransferase [Gemmatimonadota bacterium]